MEDQGKIDDQQPGTPDSAEGREKEANAAKDPNFMPKQLQDWLSAGEYGKALKFTSSKMSRGSKTSMFYAVITAFCLLKTDKQAECIETLSDYKAQKPTDSQTAKHLALIYDGLGRHSEATATLEYILSLFPNKKELSELLFFSYVREGKLLKQQNQALTLYKAHQQAIHAQWAVESMYLISLNLKFETKVLDIAYLLMLKLMKEPGFKEDKKFVMLHVKILTKQGKYKDAVDFIDRRSEFFQDKLERQQIEAGLYLMQGNYILTINTYFNMLRLNSHINQYSDMWKQYRECISIICDDFLPRKKKFDLKQDSIDRLQNSDGVNFDPITIEAGPEEVLFILVSSIRNLREGLATDTSSKRVMAIASEMQRTSFLTELEYKFVLSLHYHSFQVGEGSAYFTSILQYIEKFYDKFDVVSDVRRYLQIFSNLDAQAIRAFVRTKLNDEESTYEQNEEKPPTLKFIRWRIVHFKLSKILGAYNTIDQNEKLKLVNTIIQTYLWAHGSQETLTENDQNNLDDIIIVAVELMYTIKIYEWSTFNPINFMMISILELALSRSQNNNTIRIWLMKILQKLGLSGRFTGVGSGVKGLVDLNFEKFGAFKYSHFQTFGTERELEQTCARYEKYYSEALSRNKSSLVDGFANREFNDLNELLSKNERLESSFFKTVVQMSKLHLEIIRNSTAQGTVHKSFNKNIQMLNGLCEEDKIPTISKINVEIRKFDSFKLGQTRDVIKEEVCIEQYYEPKLLKKKKEKDLENEKKSHKGNIRVYGYKHPKVMKFMALLLRCLKDCFESKHEQLNLDMNSFLLLKNELSLTFLRNMDNIVATVKTAIKLYATQEEQNRKDLEQQELQVLEKILKNAPPDGSLSTNLPEHQEGLGGFGNVGDPATYEKIIAKLLEYNEKVNEGKEISVVEYLKKLDMDSSFAKQFEMQRHIKRAFYEEFKIHSLNYVLLLFESVMRILTTVQKDAEDDGGPGGKRGEKMQYYSKNYRRFIENRQKKIDKFIVNCIGWNHINRCIEVIDMALRDLLYKIVPTKVVIRELKTSSGKVLTKDSEYTLVERKRYVTVGKKTHVDYIFELDLKEDSEKISAQAQAKAAEEAKKRENLFYLNFEDFSMVKLKSTVFMLHFPITFTISIINIWLKLIPNLSQKQNENEEYSKEEIEGMLQARHAVKDLVQSLCNHLKSLHDYLTSIMKQKPLQLNFTLIRKSEEFRNFSDVFMKTKHTGLTNVAAEEFFLQTFEKIEASWLQSIESVAKNIIVKVSDIQMDIMKKL